MTSTKELVCENLVKKYKDVIAVNDVTLTIDQGKIYGLIGRNGAGKTTLLSLLTAQTAASSGTVTYGGETVWENQEVLDNLCFSREISAQMQGGFGAYKVKEYLRIASIYYPNWDAEYASRLIETFGLDVKKKIAKLSKGMLSMITIVLALASKANITMLDEPVAGLDVVARELFYELLLDEYTNTGRTFIISTHIIEEAAKVFEEVIMIDNGKILLKENTDVLVGNCHYISGKEEDVADITSGLKVLHTEKMGRSMSACVQLNEGEKITEIVAGRDVDVTPVPLQKIFVYLSGNVKEETHE